MPLINKVIHTIDPNKIIRNGLSKKIVVTQAMQIEAMDNNAISETTNSCERNEYPNALRTQYIEIIISKKLLRTNPHATSFTLIGKVTTRRLNAIIRF